MQGIKISAYINLNRTTAFDIFTDELALGLARKGIQVDLSPHGKIKEDGQEIGHIISWDNGNSFTIEWNPINWKKSEKMRLVINFQEDVNGTLISFEQTNWRKALDDQEQDFVGWFASEVIASFFKNTDSNSLIDWLTDRLARRPTGIQARNIYSNPEYHWPNFYAILDFLKLNSSDYLLEIGCGGGAFLHEALKSGCKAAAIDHSADMVRLAKQNNYESIEKGTLTIYEADATQLPFTSSTFTCAISTGVFQFISNPIKVFEEIYRVLTKNGKFILFTGSKELRGTPAAPEPIVSRLYFYEDNELEELARKSGFNKIEILRPDLSDYARKVGILEESISLFSSHSGQLMIAIK